MFFFRNTPEIQARADREAAIVKLMMCFPDQMYQAHPSYDQFEIVVQECEKIGWTTETLYHMFARGQMDPAVDQLIREAATSWPPAGRTVNADKESIRMIGESDTVDSDMCSSLALSTGLLTAQEAAKALTRLMQAGLHISSQSQENETCNGINPCGYGEL